jgi:hypothetical protein
MQTKIGSALGRAVAQKLSRKVAVHVQDRGDFLKV